ncbi:UMP-CMP kinase [Auriscalpium vulgare]|uniref:UMP-CMP kinase n=1 Tax=Auriscalpium vulgare TaxID=40419 RepID=A0ACB8RZX0_9AGAM|nr:UMP-CMP kinase [Auriscalpium vulgare]
MAAFVHKIADKLHLGPHHVDAATDATQPKPLFDHEKVTVIFVLGGPGAGKGTQCERLVNDFSFSHLSAGDLLRAEQDRPESQYGQLIRTAIREGTIVPMEVTVKLLENAMGDVIASKAGSDDGWKDGKGRFLIDGFPRKMDQAEKFEQDVCQGSLVLFFTTTEEVMLKRLLKRGETSGREDDNIESIKKRFVTYRDQTMPVIEYYAKEDRVAEIDSSPSVDEVYAVTKAAIAKVFAEKTT